MLAIALACVLAGDAPTIGVDVGALALPQAQTEQLHGELMTRLVESGHAVANAGAITVRLTGGGKRVHVEVQHGQRSWRRDVDGEGALMRLATIHAALDLLSQVDVIADPDPALAAAPERSVFVEADQTAAPWLPEVIAALVETDNVVKPSAEGAQWKVCVGTADERATLAVVRVDEPCGTGVASERIASDVVVALAGARTRVDPPADPVAPVAAPAPEVVATPTPAIVRAQPRPVPRRRWSGAIGVGAGAQARLDVAEPLLVVHGDARHDSGAMITVRTELAPSVEGALKVVDTFVTAGAGYAFVPRPRLRIELVATVGALLHGYRYGGGGGLHPDFAAELPLSLAIGLAPRLELAITAIGGVSPRRRRHFVNGDEVWHRDRFRFAGVVALRVVLGRKLQRGMMAVRR